jgi:heme A synthase
MVVRDVEPPRLPIGVGVNELVRQVLLGGVFSHVDADPSDYSWIVGARLRLHPEELPEEDPVRLDPKECFTKMNEDRGMENDVRVQIEVLNS